MAEGKVIAIAPKRKNKPKFADIERLIRCFRAIVLIMYLVICDVIVHVINELHHKL
jgi:hypothetical protein